MQYNFDHLCDQLTKFHDTHPDGIMLLRGPTASGKTGLSIKLADEFPVEIISADSRQVYKGMDIGTDKIDKVTRAKIPHHLIDVVTPDTTFTAGQRKQAVYELIPQIQDRGNMPLIVGGTGLYFDMLYKNYNLPDVPPDPGRREDQMVKEKQQPGRLHDQLKKVDPPAAQKLHPNNTRYVLRALEIYEKTGKTKTQRSAQQPVDWPMLMVGLRDTKEQTNRRINTRIREMIAEGLIDEVQGLLNAGYPPEETALQGIGYKEIIGYLQGQYDLDRAKELLRRNTHHLGKKQRSRFRRYIADSKANPKAGVRYLIYDLPQEEGSDS